MSEKDIYIKLTESQANTLLRVVETHPDASKFGAKGTRNEITRELRNALTAEVREGGEHDGDWAEWSTSLTDQDIATPDDIRADFGLMPKNPLREDLTADDLEQASTGKPAAPDETPYEGDDAADGQVGESTEEPQTTPAWDYTGADAEADLAAEEQRESDGDSETEGDKSNEGTNEDDSNNS